MEANGGSNNAYTSQNVTVYQDWFPRSAMPLIFDIEADRIQNLSFDPQKIESERQVVASERRSSVDNDNGGLLEEQLWATAFIAHPYVYDKLSYDPRDLSPVARISSTVISISVPPSLGVNSLKELFAMVRAQPGTLNWASTTGATDLIVQSFVKKSGLDIVRVPYRNPVEALTDTVNGRVHLYWAAHDRQAQARAMSKSSRRQSEPTSLF
jgi:hypothetical protein